MKAGVPPATSFAAGNRSVDGPSQVVAGNRRTTGTPCPALSAGAIATTAKPTAHRCRGRKREREIIAGNSRAASAAVARDTTASSTFVTIAASDRSIDRKSQAIAGNTCATCTSITGAESSPAAIAAADGPHDGEHEVVAEDTSAALTAISALAAVTTIAAHDAPRGRDYEDDTVAEKAYASITTVAAYIEATAAATRATGHRHAQYTEIASASDHRAVAAGATATTTSVDATISSASAAASCRGSGG
jgi:hypothetical protein